MIHIPHIITPTQVVKVMNASELLTQLRALEVELHQPEVRCDRARLDQLLHESFFEFGRSGQSYNKADIIKLLTLETETGPIWAQDFVLAEITSDVALLTYRSASIAGNGELSRPSNRTSLWQQTQHGWQMRFHQGTPTEIFVKDKGSQSG